MKTLSVNIPEKEYDIIIEKGCIAKTGEYIKARFSKGKCALITDENVGALYADAVIKSLRAKGFEVFLFAIKPGEPSKSMETLQQICAFLACSGINRGDFLVVLGGGVTGDIAGFAASVFLRGIPFVQIPTSLLAQIDSSVGGKVAADIPEGKNLVGSFHHPSLVLIDPDVLHTLPRMYFEDGMAEAIKYGCIKDASLFSFLLESEENTLWEHMEEVIFTCVNIKRQVVEMDEKDKGERMLLNFGHTAGHGIEKFYHYEGIAHGQAIAMGIALFTQKSEKIGFTAAGTYEKLLTVLKKYSLPSKVPEEVVPQLALLCAGDKKNIGKTIHLILISKIGCGCLYPIEYSEFEEFLK